MTVRLPPSVQENVWHDAQRVAQQDLQVEQNHTDQTIAAVVNNHFGSGVIPSSLTQNVLFNSDNLTPDQIALIVANIFDGTGIQPAAQPSDINLGNQLEIVLTNSAVKGRKSLKVAIIGLAFDDTMISERLTFFKNESQTTGKHYKKILGLFFNDFKGNGQCSRAFGGTIVIKEARSFQLSRDALMVAQDVMPDIFWRDFRLPNAISTLQQILQAGIGPEFSVDALRISTGGRTNKSLVTGDVTSQIGQKFQATTNNIQKATLLLAVNPLSGVPENHMFDWSGDIIVSIYPLQTSVACSADIVPNLAIDFDPAVTPAAQVSFNLNTLQDAGYVLNDVLQPVDFVFSNTAIAASGGIIPGAYYAVTMKRSGDASQNVIQLGVGDDRLDNSRETLFSGVWVDVEEEDLWFQIWTDAVKLSDGQGYDAGNGMYLAKTTIDQTTGATIDNIDDGFSFTDTGESVLNIAVLQATSQESFDQPDERTGNPTFTRQQFVPTLSLVNQLNLENLQEISEPLIVGGVKDTNPKNKPVIEGTQTIIGLAKGDNFCIVNPNADLLSNNLLGSKLIPNKNNASQAYRIIKVTECTDLLGDVDGNGIIDTVDLAEMSALVGEGLSLLSTQAKIVNGTIDVLSLLRADVDQDGYVTSSDLQQLVSYLNRTTNSFSGGSSFTHICLEVENLVGRDDSHYNCNDGYIYLPSSDGYYQTKTIISVLDNNQIYFDGYLTSPLLQNDNVFNTVPFQNVSYQIVYKPFWKDYLLSLSSSNRQVPAAFTYPNGVVHGNCSNVVISPCKDINENPPVIDPGRTDFFVPDNLMIGSGEILRPNGDFYKNDLEIGYIELQLPPEPLKEVKIDVFGSLIADRGDNSGLTRKGFPALKYANCTYVGLDDFALNRVRITAAITAYYPNLDGYAPNGLGFEIIIDNIIGVYLDNNGILTLTLQDLAEDNVYKTLVTKISLTVFLKRAGFNNLNTVVTSNEFLGLISS